MISRRTVLGAVAGTVGVAAMPRPAMAMPAHSGPLLDSHLHLLGADETRYPRAPGAKTGGGGARPGGVRVVPTAADVTSWMVENGVARAVAVQKKSAYGFDNRYTLDAVDVLPERFVAVVVIDTEAATTPALLRTLAAQHDVVGLRLTGTRGPVGAMPWLDSPAAHACWKVADALGLAVDLMAMPPDFDEGTLVRYAALARHYPRTRLVLDHAGWPKLAGDPDHGITPAHRRLRDLGNVFFKITTINFDLIEDAKLSPSDFVTAAARSLGADRTMWGSDLGNSAGTYPEMIARMRAATAGLDGVQYRQVTHDTAAAVFRAGGGT